MESRSLDTILNKPKLLWVGDIGTTGYAQVLNQAGPILQKYFNLHIFALNYNWKPGIEKTAVSFPIQQENLILLKEVNFHYYHHFDILKQVIKNLQPNIVFFLNDLYQLKEALRQVEEFKHIKKVIYLALDIEKNSSIDCQCVQKAFNNADLVFLMSKHAQGILPHTNKVVLEHPINQNFTTWNQFDKTKARNKLYPGMLKADTFVFLSVAFYCKRKRIEDTIEAFCKLQLETSTPTALIIKTVLNSQQTLRLKLKNSAEMINEIILNFRNKTGKHPTVLIENRTFDDKEMVELYACADAMVSNSSGEGFGLTPFEFVMTEKPALVANNSSYSVYFPPKFLIPARKLPLECRLYSTDIIEKLFESEFLEDHAFLTTIAQISKESFFLEDTILNQNDLSKPRFIFDVRKNNTTLQEYFEDLSKRTDLPHIFQVSILANSLELPKYLKDYCSVNLKNLFPNCVTQRVKCEALVTGKGLVKISPILNITKKMKEVIMDYKKYCMEAKSLKTKLQKIVGLDLFETRLLSHLRQLVPLEP